MRTDMAKVIVERPRYGSRNQRPRKGYRKDLQRTEWENEPKREARWQRIGFRKPFNEHLGPLRRFLQSRVGRLWNEVYAEICEHLRRDSVVQDHVRDHVDGYVVTQVVMIDGIPCHGVGRAYGEPLGAWPWSELFYVCPASGRMKRVPPRREKPRKEKPRAVLLRDGRACVLKERSWWLVQVKPFPAVLPPTDATMFDAAIGRKLDRNQAKRLYGAEVYAAKIERHLSKRELKQLPIPIDLQQMNRHGRVRVG